MPVLTSADNIIVGTKPASRVYVGGNRVWPPAAAIPNLINWWDASMLPLGVVYSWPTMGVGHPLNLGWGTYPTAVTGPKGLSVVQFGGNCGFYCPDSFIDANYTIVYVANSWTHGRVLCAYPRNLLVGFWGDYEDCMYAGNWVVPTTVGKTGAWKLYSTYANDQFYYPRFHSNGVLLGYDVPCDQGFQSSFWLGGWGDTEHSWCNVAEVMVFNRQLADGERVQVEAYLRNKWF